MKIGLSSGCAYKLFNKIAKDTGLNLENDYLNSVICIYRLLQKKIKFNAFELILIDKFIKHYDLSLENYIWLKNLDYFSVHLMGEYKRKILDDIERFPYIDFLICHIDKKNNLPPTFFYKYSDKILYENIDFVKYDFKVKDNICFDIAHAETTGDIKDQYVEYRENIKEIHISRHDLNHKIINTHHLPLNKNMYSFEEMYGLNKLPIIIESTCNSIDELIKEFKYVKKVIFNKE